MSNTINVNYMTSTVSRYTGMLSKSGVNGGQSADMMEAINKAAAKEDEVVEKSTTTAATKAVSKEDMTLEEYKQYISDTISGFPLHPSQAGESYAIRISDEGFEAMKNDPEYEKWVLDDLKECFATPVPAWYQAMGGPSRYTIFTYGATKEDFRGEGYPVGVQGNKARFDSDADNSFWSRRAEKEKQINEQVQKRAIKKKQMAEELAKRIEKERLGHQRVMEEFYREWLAGSSVGVGNIGSKTGFASQSVSSSVAVSSYEASFMTADV